MAEFNEQSLLADIEQKWGVYGAHADLCRWMIAEIDRLRDLVDRLLAVLDSQGREARRGG